LKSFGNSLAISAISAVGGAIAGALLAYAVVTGNPQGILRRSVTSASGVLAQFGGVTLAFAFISSLGTTGFVTVFLKDHGLDIFANGVWLYELSGLTLIYLYSRFRSCSCLLPALDGGGRSGEATPARWQHLHYWRYCRRSAACTFVPGCTPFCSRTPSRPRLRLY
jgi:putative spermidine/putrescine transport system permease protein